MSTLLWWFFRDDVVVPTIPGIVRFTSPAIKFSSMQNVTLEIAEL